MIKLERDQSPVRCERCNGPISVQSNMKTEKNEEQGTFWVFVWPQLVPWPHKISWLFCPAGPGKKTPWRVGDMWGVDSEGNLLIVETKLIKYKESPFKKFLNHKMPSFEILRDHWLERLDCERELRKLYPNGLGSDFPKRRMTPEWGPVQWVLLNSGAGRT